MTKWLHSQKNITRLQNYVDENKSVVGLSDWAITVLREPSRAGTCATINHTGYRTADLRVYRPFFRHGEEWCRNTVAHELTHLIMVPIATTAGTMSDCAKTLQEEEWRGINFSMRVLSKAEEEVVEHLEPLIGRLLSPFPKK